MVRKNEDETEGEVERVHFVSKPSSVRSCASFVYSYYVSQMLINNNRRQYRTKTLLRIGSYPPNGLPNGLGQPIQRPWRPMGRLKI